MKVLKMNKEQSKQRNRYILFYFLLVYVFAFLFWWTYLLYQNNHNHHHDQIELAKIKHEATDSGLPFENTETFEDLLSDYNRQKTMIVTEGIVFSLILAFGLFKVRQAFVKDIEVAQQQRNFILSITHELKSPLSSIKLMSETLLKRELDKPTQQKLLRNTLDESNRLETLVENILLAAKIENNSYGFSKEPQDLSQICKVICEQFQISKSVVVKTDIQKSTSILGDKAALSSIIINLLENAVKYAPESEYYELLLKKEGNYVRLDLSDQGPGIANNQKSKIFEKFYRIGNEETRKAKGTGLGLYIVYELVDYHNGSIEVLDNIPKGAKFRVKFKL